MRARLQSDLRGPRGRRVVRHPKTKRRTMSIMDLERDVTYRSKKEAAKALGVSVAEVARLISIGRLVRLWIPDR